MVNKITPDGLYYSNSSGENIFLDFNECNENWLAYRKRAESLNDEQVANLREKDKTVGQRDIDVDQNFIEFFTRPFTRFEFITPTQIAEYENLRDSIFRYGWTTVDLS